MPKKTSDVDSPADSAIKAKISGLVSNSFATSGCESNSCLRPLAVRKKVGFAAWKIDANTLGFVMKTLDMDGVLNKSSSSLKHSGKY
ncbi:hypothetical protein KJ780_05185 [Candidatus Micrarchaeota archaeon]|nr:hypothetical protein [Candidatus Micrarchaeota archaeon]